MADRIYILSIGSINAIGGNIDQMSANLNNSKTGLRRSNKFHLNLSFFITGEAIIDENLILNYSKKNGMQSRNIILSDIAVQEVLCPFDLDELKQYRVGLFSSNTTGGIDLSELYFNGQPEYMKQLSDHDCGASTSFLINKYPIFSYNTTINTACSSSANSILLGANMIKKGIIEMAVVGGVDTLTNFTIQGFNALNIYDQELCAPFDRNRKGLNLGEGAGYLMLASEHIANKFPHLIIGEFLGGHNSNDAYHQTSASPNANGNTLAMQGAIINAGINKESIQYLNAHGTATPNNDLSESIAIKNTFGEKVPIINSTKSYTGHTLAAAGAIEAIICMLSMKQKTIFKSLNFNASIEETNIIPNTNKIENIQLQYCMSNSFGFGGNCTSLIFKSNP